MVDLSFHIRILENADFRAIRLPDKKSPMKVKSEVGHSTVNSSHFGCVTN